MESKAGEWIGEASDIEKLYEQSHKRGSFLLVYQLSLSSVHPLQEGQVKTALIHLHRKCPALRVCFGQRNGKTWLRYMAEEKLDFQVVRDAAQDDLRDLLQTYQYNSEEGPLWCVRLLMNAGDSLALDEDLPCTSHLFFGIHHGITDGFTMMKTCGSFVKILNDVIDNQPICDKEQIGYFVSDTENEKLVAVKMSALKQDRPLMQELISRAEDKGAGMPLLLKIRPSPEGEDKSCSLIHVFDKGSTQRFIEKCKAERVSISSGFAALVNASMVSFFAENRYIEDSYRMCNGHVINSRRYWPADSSDAMGCHALSPLNLWIDVPRDLHKKFWDFARNLHQDLHHHLKEESILLREAYIKLTNNEEPSYDEMFCSSAPMQVDCVFSNLGDVTHYFGDGGPYVKPYLLVRHASLHHTDIQNFAYFIHTFRGRFTVNLLYNSKYVAKAVAQEHFSRIISMMENVKNGSFY